MEDIEEHDVAAKIRKRCRDVVTAKFDVPIGAGRNLCAATNLARIKVEAKDRLRTGALPQIKRKQPYAAAEIEDWLGRTA